MATSPCVPMCSHVFRSAVPTQHDRRRLCVCVHFVDLFLCLFTRLPSPPSTCDMSTMHVHGLDELSLLHIFDLLPIPDLLLAGQVCARWNVFRAKSGLTRHSLTLLLGGEKTRQYVGNSLYKIPRYWRLLNDDGSRMFPDGTYNDDLNERIVLNLPVSLNMDYAQFLVELFPAISNFVVGMNIETGHVLDQITYMLKQWSSKLVSLRIDTGYDDSKYKMSDHANVDTHLRLLEAVNRLSSLVRLEFDVNFSLIKDFGQDRIDLPILAQLEQFKFYTGDESDYIFDSLKQYGESNEGLKEICLHSPVHFFDKLTTLSPEFSSRFSHLQVRLKWFSILDFTSLTDHFTKLTTMTIFLDSQIDPLDVERQLVFGSLAPLTQLVYLTLWIDGRVLDSLQYFEDEQQEDYVQLKSVKVLTLRITPPKVSTHNIFWDLDFGWLFPKVQVVHFIRAEELCDQCTADGHNVGDDYENYCLKAMIKPFRECAQLQLVSTNHPPVEWLPEDLKDEVDDEEEGEEEEEEDYYYDEQSGFNDEDCKIN